MHMDAKKKAELIEEGGVEVDGPILSHLSRSTAGPGAGLESFFFNSGGHRVRLGVRKSSRFKACSHGEEVVILKDGQEFASGRIEDAIAHCPEQVYVTISERCVFDCKYCPVPKLQGRVKGFEEVMELVENGSKRPGFKAISITSGVWKSPEEELCRVARLVKEMVKYNVPIGVSIYPTDNSSEALREAGACEVKYNVETIDPNIFEKVCPGLSLEYIKKALEHAVSLFGRNHVFTNILVGLGESDEDVLLAVEEFADKGIIPILRKVNPHPLRAGEAYMENVRGERLLRLAEVERRILDKHGLRADLALTGCLVCTGCDITPHRDI